MKPERVTDDSGRVLAVVVRGCAVPYNDVRFYSEPEDALQVGAMRWAKGKVLMPHRHVPPGRLVSPAEVLFVHHGLVQVTLYVEERPFRTFALQGGDCVVLLAGGHGFEMMEDSTVWEVKTGPYLPTDKVWLAEPSGHSPPCGAG